MTWRCRFVIEQRSVGEEKKQDLRELSCDVEEFAAQQRLSAGEEHDRDTEVAGLGKHAPHLSGRELGAVEAVEELVVAACAVEIALTGNAVDDERRHVGAGFLVTSANPCCAPLAPEQAQAANSETRIVQRDTERDAKRLENGCLKCRSGVLCLAQSPLPRFDVAGIVGRDLDDSTLGSFGNLGPPARLLEPGHSGIAEAGHKAIVAGGQPAGRRLSLPSK